MSFRVVIPKKYSGKTGMGLERAQSKLAGSSSYCQ